MHWLWRAHLRLHRALKAREPEDVEVILGAARAAEDMEVISGAAEGAEVISGEAREPEVVEVISGVAAMVGAFMAVDTTEDMATG